MNWHTVESSNVDALAYDGEYFYTRFKSGAVYRYENVTDTIFKEILGAASVGRTLNELVKSKPDEYPYTRLS